MEIKLAFNSVKNNPTLIALRLHSCVSAFFPVADNPCIPQECPNTVTLMVTIPAEALPVSDRRPGNSVSESGHNLKPRVVRHWYALSHNALFMIFVIVLPCCLCTANAQNF